MRVHPPTAHLRVLTSQVEAPSADVTTALAVWGAVALTAPAHVVPTAHKIAT